MDSEIKAVTELLRELAKFPVLGLALFFGFKLFSAFRRNEKPAPPTGWAHYLYLTFAARWYAILTAMCTAALIYDFLKG